MLKELFKGFENRSNCLSFEVEEIKRTAVIIWLNRNNNNAEEKLPVYKTRDKIVNVSKVFWEIDLQFQKSINQKFLWWDYLPFKIPKRSYVFHLYTQNNGITFLNHKIFYL